MLNHPWIIRAGSAMRKSTIVVSGDRDGRRRVLRLESRSGHTVVRGRVNDFETARTRTHTREQTTLRHVNDETFMRGVT